ncbi:hypothetical protein FNX48_000030 [Streptomyces sp. IF17]|nr:hypothetical protein [Streptomyces alkaliphilus]
MGQQGSETVRHRLRHDVLIIGANGRFAIATLVERTARYTMPVQLPGGAHNAGTVRDCPVRILQALPAHLRGSLTRDREPRWHAAGGSAGPPVCPSTSATPPHPGSAAPTGTPTGCFASTSPKGTDLSLHSPEDLEHLARELNGRPRKALDRDTPAERLRALLTT